MFEIVYGIGFFVWLLVIWPLMLRYGFLPIAEDFGDYMAASFFGILTAFAWPVMLPLMIIAGFYKMVIR